jgi:uncharacterized protein (TIGR00255 family)
MRSMTGYGRASRPFEKFQIRVELSGVNRRGLEIALQLPREWVALEARARETMQNRVARGRIQANVTCQADANGTATSPVLDLVAARAFHQAALNLQRELGLTGDLPLTSVLAAPGVMRAPESVTLPDGEAASAALQAALDEALQALVAMRADEGRRLAEELRGRIAALGKWATEIESLHPAVAEKYREALVERLQRARIEVAVDDDRVAKEVALFADRSDISEELARLRGHLEQFEKLTAEEGAVGRTLDFLAQEMARECNTLGVKCNDLAISRLVVACKAEVEKIREQVQNIE